MAVCKINSNCEADSCLPDEDTPAVVSACFGVFRSRPSHPHVQGLPLHACPTGIPTNGVPRLSKKAQVRFPNLHKFMSKFLSRIFLKDSDTGMKTFQMAQVARSLVAPSVNSKPLPFCGCLLTPLRTFLSSPPCPFPFSPLGSGMCLWFRTMPCTHLLPLFPVPSILSWILPILITQRKKKIPSTLCVSLLAPNISSCSFPEYLGSI